MPNTDIVIDTLQRVAEHKKIPAKVLAEVEASIRADWGGERVYIPKRGENAQQQLSERDARIRREYRHGEREPLLARRHGISVRRVRQILQCSGDVASSRQPPTGNTLP